MTVQNVSINYKRKDKLEVATERVEETMKLAFENNCEMLTQKNGQERSHRHFKGPAEMSKK